MAMHGKLFVNGIMCGCIHGILESTGFVNFKGNYC